MYLLLVGSAVKLAQPFLYITLRLREAPPSAARSAPRRCYRTACGSWGFRSFVLFCRCALPLRLGSLYWPGAAASSSTAAPATAEVPQKKASIDVNFLRRFRHLAQSTAKIATNVLRLFCGLRLQPLRPPKAVRPRSPHTLRPAKNARVVPAASSPCLLSAARWGTPPGPWRCAAAPYKRVARCAPRAGAAAPRLLSFVLLRAPGVGRWPPFPSGRA